MNPCPFSLEHLFLLISAFEGLSLWSAFGGLPNALKRIDLTASWKKVEAEIMEKKGRQPSDQEFKKFFKVCNRFDYYSSIVRILKSVPVIMASGALVFFSVYPVFMHSSASTLFYDYWEVWCLIIAIISLIRLIAFAFSVRFFKRFERQYGKAVVFKEYDLYPDDYCVLSYV